MCKYNIKLIYLTFVHCTCKSEKHKQIFPNKNTNKVRHMKSISSLSLVKTIIELYIVKS